MDNAEILTEMGFELVTGYLWRSDDFGFINIAVEDNLKKIASEIFKKGYLTHKAEVRKVLGVE